MVAGFFFRYFGRMSLVWPLHGETFFFVNIFGGTCLYWTAVLACTGRSEKKKKKQPLSLSRGCKNVIPRPRRVLKLASVLDEVLRSIELVRNSRDLEACLRCLDGNSTPRFENPVAHIHKGCPLQPTSRCFMVDGRCHPLAVCAAKSTLKRSVYGHVQRLKHASHTSGYDGQVFHMREAVAAHFLSGAPEAIQDE